MAVTASGFIIQDRKSGDPMDATTSSNFKLNQMLDINSIIVLPVYFSLLDGSCTLAVASTILSSVGAHYADSTHAQSA